MLGAAGKRPVAPIGRERPLSSLLDCHILEEDWRKEAQERNGASTAPARLPVINRDQKAVPDANLWESAVEEMTAFQHLGDDWDGKGARVPSDEVLVSAIGLAYTLHEQRVGPPSRIVPGPEGSVIFEWQDPDGTYTEVEIVGWLFAEVMRIEPGQPAKHWSLPTKQAALLVGVTALPVEPVYGRTPTRRSR